MLCVTGPQMWFRRHSRPNVAQGSWVQRARPQVTGPARPCDRPAKAGSKSTNKGQSVLTNYDALHVKNGIVKFVSSKARAASRRQPRESSSKSLRQRPGLRPAPLATALSRRRLWRCAEHQQRCSQHACRALIHDRPQCPSPLRAGLLGPRVVSPPSPGASRARTSTSHRPAHSAIGRIFFSITRL